MGVKFSLRFGSQRRVEMEPNLKKEDYSLDFILETYVGGGGKWQWKQLLYLVIVISATQVPFYLHMYSAYTPDHR